MNELQRQAYLSAIGIEGYMPRWRLPFSPEPYQCVLPPGQSVDESIHPESASEIQPQNTALPRMNILEGLIAPITTVVPINVPTPLIAENQSPKVNPFSLSIWRPIIGMLVIDSRNSALALPTDLLLNNILHTALRNKKFSLSEEILRWPMIENRFVSRTETEARNELQTWLAVENELRPIEELWLFGENASQYFISHEQSHTSNQWQRVDIDFLSTTSQLNALILPSLNDLLNHPAEKAALWSVIR